MAKDGAQPGSSSTEGNGDALNSIVGDLVSNEPRINSNAIDALMSDGPAQQPEQREAGAAAGPEGSQPPRSAPSGVEEFNPAIHQSKNGRPVKTKDGKFARKPGPRGTAAAQSAARVESSKDEPAASPIDYRAAGETLAGLIFGATQGVFGDEWKPDADESENLTGAAHKFCAANGYDFPPGVALAIAFIAYAAPRLNKPETSKRIKSGLVSIGFIKPPVEPQPAQQPAQPVQADQAQPQTKPAQGNAYADPRGGVLARLNGQRPPYQPA